MKWEPVVAMVAILGLGAWLVYQGRGAVATPDIRPGAVVFDAQVVGVRGWIEHVPAVGPAAEGVDGAADGRPAGSAASDDTDGEAADSATADGAQSGAAGSASPANPADPAGVRPEDLGTFRWLPRDGAPTEPMSREVFIAAYGAAVVERIERGGEPALFRLLNISSWASIGWVVLGFTAQAIFATRFLIQWIVSERRRESVVPEIFWWISLVGGVSLFVYFVWRRDIVGVFGQSSGVVIYARNLRLIGKQRRRAARRAGAGEAAEATGSADQPGDVPADQPAGSSADAATPTAADRSDVVGSATPGDRTTAAESG